MNDHILKQLEIILKLSSADNVRNVDLRISLINSLALSLIEDAKIGKSKK